MVERIRKRILDRGHPPTDRDEFTDHLLVIDERQEKVLDEVSRSFCVAADGDAFINKIQANPDRSRKRAAEDKEFVCMKFCKRLE